MTLPPRPQQHNRLSTCHRHPSQKPVTGFCAACLRERLAGIDPDTHQETPVTQLAAELRRSKSYSSSTNPNASSSTTTTTTTTTTATSSEPRRKSCDVGPRSSLSDLFHTEDKRKNHRTKLKDVDLGLELKEEEENETEIRVSSLNVNDVEAHVEGFEEEGEFKTMKEFIDLELEKKKNGGKDFKSLWEAASVSFSKRLVKWQRKEYTKKKKENGLVGMEKPSLRKLGETQSEVGEYGLGRRSCDTDPRSSVDVARLSIDDSRYSFDAPRASWDGCLIGKAYPRLVPLLSVIEDVKVPSSGEEDVKENAGMSNAEESSPGGTEQTRDYYSSERRRRSFDRSGSKTRVGLGDDELKCVTNSKVSPETVELFHGAKLLVTEKELRDSNWYSLKDRRVENIDSLAKDAHSAAGGVGRKGLKFKKMQGWRNVWNIWGLMQRRSEAKNGDEESSSMGRNVVDLPISESWHTLGGVANGEANGTVSHKLLRSYTVSARDASQKACCASVVEAKGNGVQRSDELMLQRNQSARYPPNSLDHGLLRFYVTPSRSYGRSKSGKGSSLKNSNSVASNVL